MNELLRAFFSFSRIERLGFATLGALLLALTICLASMRLWVRSPVDAADDGRLLAAYEAWKRNEVRISLASADEGEPRPASSLAPFDPNTLDSAGFIRLGMPARAVKGLLAWRRKGKRFYRPEDLKPLYNLPEAQYVRLAPYIRIAGTERFEERPPTPFPGKYPELPAVIDMNSADSALLDRGVRGIGATLARKIIARRAALGGFLRHEQLLEIYSFPDSTFRQMKEKLHIRPGSVQRMGLNTATLERMSLHPYVGEKTARNILLYREGIGRYERLEQLREVPLMSEEIYRKIAPYFTVD